MIGSIVETAPHRPLPRASRPVWLTVAACAIALGLASRRFGDGLPPFLAAFAGDTLWALLVFAIAGSLSPRAAMWVRAAGSLAFAIAIECSQLYHAEWLDAVRATAPGALVLGSGFLWSDFACYAAGIAIGAAGERWAARRR